MFLSISVEYTADRLLNNRTVACVLSTSNICSAKTVSCSSYIAYTIQIAKTSFTPVFS